MAASYVRHYPGICLDRLRKSRNFLSGCLLLQLNFKTDAQLQVRYLFIYLFLCEAWARTRSDKHRPTVLENRMMRNKFGPKTG